MHGYNSSHQFKDTDMMGFEFGHLKWEDPSAHIIDRAVKVDVKEHLLGADIYLN